MFSSKLLQEVLCLMTLVDLLLCIKKILELVFKGSHL